MSTGILPRSNDDERELWTSRRYEDGLVRTYYGRYMAEDTDLYLFVSGLGDQAVCEQLGSSFLKHIDTYGDPELGRIIISVGSGASAFIPYRGDFNLHWVIGFSTTVNWLPIYMSKVLVPPQLFLTPSKIIGEQVNDANLESLYFPMGCGDVFHPLNNTRVGLGFTGLDTKPPIQRDSILGPVLDRDDFEWRGRDLSQKNWNPLASEWVHLDELNVWYNSKEAVFGMFFEESLELGLVTGRIFETIGSGTPIICYENPAIKDVLGPYRYQSSSREDTLRHVDEILKNPQFVRAYMNELVKHIHNIHSYDRRIATLLNYLQEMKK